LKLVHFGTEARPKPNNSRGGLALRRIFAPLRVGSNASRAASGSGVFLRGQRDQRPENDETERYCKGPSKSLHILFSFMQVAIEI